MNENQKHMTYIRHTFHSIICTMHCIHSMVQNTNINTIHKRIAMVCMLYVVRCTYPSVIHGNSFAHTNRILSITSTTKAIDRTYTYDNICWRVASYRVPCIMTCAFWSKKQSNKQTTTTRFFPALTNFRIYPVFKFLAFVEVLYLMQLVNQWYCNYFHRER